jgi:hypothetical protein
VRTLTSTTVLGVGALIVVTAGVSVAATSSSAAKTLSACLSSSSHRLTQVSQTPSKPLHCAAGSHRITWNAKGVTGARGPAGPRGPAAATYVPLVGFGSGQVEGCGGTSYTPQPAMGCPVDPTSTFDSQLINSADFGSAATVRLEASFIVNDTGGAWAESEMCARLFDVTIQAVVGKAICATNTAEDTAAQAFRSSAPVALPKGNDNYKVEVAMPLSVTDTLDNSRGGFLTQAVAVVEAH